MLRVVKVLLCDIKSIEKVDEERTLKTLQKDFSKVYTEYEWYITICKRDVSFSTNYIFYTKRVEALEAQTGVRILF